MPKISGFPRSVQRPTPPRGDGQARGRASDARSCAALTPAAAEAALLRSVDPRRYAGLIEALEQLAQWEAGAARRRWQEAGYRA